MQGKTCLEKEIFVEIKISHLKQKGTKNNAEMALLRSCRSAHVDILLITWYISQSHRNKVCNFLSKILPQACHFYKKETSAQVFSSEFFRIYFSRIDPVAVSENDVITIAEHSEDCSMISANLDFHNYFEN